MQPVIEGRMGAGTTPWIHRIRFGGTDHVDRVRAAVNDGGSRYTDFGINVAEAVAYIIPPDRRFVRSTTVERVEQVHVPVLDAWTGVGIKGVGDIVLSRHENHVVDAARDAHA